MADLKISMGLMSCKDCRKYNIGTKIYDSLSWETDSPIQMIGFDEEDNSITIEEEKLMELIQLVNPGQSARKIKLIGINETR